MASKWVSFPEGMLPSRGRSRLERIPELQEPCLFRGTQCCPRGLIFHKSDAIFSSNCISALEKLYFIESITYSKDDSK